MFAAVFPFAGRRVLPWKYPYPISAGDTTSGCFISQKDQPGSIAKDAPSFGLCSIMRMRDLKPTHRAGVFRDDTAGVLT
jgi:hypothetical protein